MLLPFSASGIVIRSHGPSSWLIPSGLTARRHTSSAGAERWEVWTTETWRPAGIPRRYKPRSMAGIGAFVSPGRSLASALDRARLADELGFDGVFTTHIAGRDSLTVLALYAAVTERVRLGTGVVPIFSRTPAAMAQTAAT